MGILWISVSKIVARDEARKGREGEAGQHSGIEVGMGSGIIFDGEGATGRYRSGFSRGARVIGSYA